MNRIEYRIAGVSEAYRRDNFPITVELHDACVFGIVVLSADAEVQRARRIGGNRKNTACGGRVLHTDPLTFERAVAIEQLKTRVLAIGNEYVGAARHKRQTVRITELALSRSLPAPLTYFLPAGIEVGDATVH